MPRSTPRSTGWGWRSGRDAARCPKAPVQRSAVSVAPPRSRSAIFACTRGATWRLATNTGEPSARRVTRISSGGPGASAAISTRVSPSSAPASRISTPGPMSSAISGTTSTRGDWPMVMRPTTGRGALTRLLPARLEHVEQRARRQLPRLPEPALREPAERFRRVRSLHEHERLAALEEAAEGHAAGAAHLDEGELRHVVVDHGTLDEGDLARAVEDHGDHLPRLDELGEAPRLVARPDPTRPVRSEEHTSELQSRPHLVCRL